MSNLAAATRERFAPPFVLRPAAAQISAQAGSAGRDFVRLFDEDDYIDVEVTCDPADKAAGAQLEMECDKAGVERNVLT